MLSAHNPPPRPDSGFSGFSKTEDDHRPSSDTENHTEPVTFKSATSPWVVFLLFVLCLFMHALLVAIHLALVIIRFKLHGDAIQVPGNNFNEIAGTLFYSATFPSNTIIKVRDFISMSHLSSSMTRSMHRSI